VAATAAAQPESLVPADLAVDGGVSAAVDVAEIDPGGDYAAAVASRVEAWVVEQFPGSSLVEHHDRKLRFKVTASGSAGADAEAGAAVAAATTAGTSTDSDQLTSSVRKLPLLKMFVPSLSWQTIVFHIEKLPVPKGRWCSTIPAAGGGAVSSSGG